MSSSAAIPATATLPVGTGLSAGGETTGGVSTAAPFPPAPPTFSRRVARSTFSRFGAKVGLTWIAVVGLLAVLAPVLASSHPLALKVNNHWSSPWLAHLTVADVTLLVTAAAGIGLAFLRRWSLGRRALVLLGVAAATALLAWQFGPAPGTVWYATYRVDLAAGKAQAAYYTPIHFSPDDSLRDTEMMDNVPPTGGHLLGTSADSQDVAANMIYGCRVALSIGFVSTGVAVVLGVIMGALMGYLGGWVDLLGMRVAEIFEAVPTLLLLLAFAPLFQQAGPLALYVMMAVIGFFASFGYAEFVRAEFLTLRNRDFVHAARAAGLPLRSILFRHILPNGLTPVIVNVSFGIAGAILTETSLTFLGVGLNNEASWGKLLNQALSLSGTFCWWLAIYPGAAIFLTVFSYNLIGEALRDALDPRLVQNH